MTVLHVPYSAVTVLHVPCPAEAVEKLDVEALADMLLERLSAVTRRARIRQSGLDYGLGLSHFQQKILKTLYGVPSSLGRGSGEPGRYCQSASVLPSKLGTN